MRSRELKQLQAELGYLVNLLERIPEDEIINRLSYENRKHKIEEILTNYSTCFRDPAHALLTFKGKPVVDSFGIFADFGSKAVTKFSEAVTAIAANIAGTKLGDRGKIPNNDDYQLLITGTALGSFGFEIEENLVQLECATQQDDPSIMEQAMEKAQSLFKASIGSDDELLEILLDMDNRTISEFHDFLTTMVENEAYCAIEVDDTYFSFKNEAQVQRSAKRINVDSFIESDEVYFGQLIGVLPESRSFEFLTSPSNTLIKGKVGSQITDAMDLNHILEINLKITVHTKKIGTGNPRLTLIDYKKI